MAEKLKVVSASVLVTVPVKGKKKGYEIKNEPVEIEPADEYKIRRLIESGCLRKATVPARKRSFEAARKPVSRKAPRKVPKRATKKGTRKGGR